MKFGSVCSGIEAASVAWEPLGFTPAWFSEIARWPSKFLSTRYPSVPNHGSLVGLADRLAGDDRRIDLLVGGTPCQAFSVSGLRGGLTDERGNLTLEFARLAAALRPRWVLWENVPGVLSDDTNAFGCLLGALCELGYGCAWRVLDAQFFGVAQRRQRVFLVGHLGAAAAAGAVLFEPDGVRRNPPPRRASGEDVAGTLTTGTGGGRYDKQPLTVVPEVARCLTTSAQRLDSETETFITASFDETQVTSPGNRSSCDPSTAALTASGRPPSIAFNARQDPVHSEHTTGALDTDGSSQAVCVTGTVTHALRSVGADASEDGTGRGTPITPVMTRVRRLTPRECERLQGFPSVTERLTLRVCSENPNSPVYVDVRNLRLPVNACNAEDAEIRERARLAESSFRSDQAVRDALAAVHVRIDSVPRVVALRSRGRFLWSARSAEPPEWCRQAIQEGVFARALVALAHAVGLETIDGGEASQAKRLASTPLASGSWFAASFGRGTEPDARAAMREFEQEAKRRSITSSHGPSTPPSDSSKAISSFSALAVMTSFIHPQTEHWNGGELVVDIEHDYTSIDAAKDTPRYAALGNSMAVPVIRWLGERIAKVDALLRELEAA